MQKLPRMRSKPNNLCHLYKIFLIFFPLGIAHLSNVLFQEEKDTYEAQQKQEKNNELASLYNISIQMLALIHIITRVAIPVFEAFEDRMATVKSRIEQLEKLKAQLLREAEEISSCSDSDEDDRDDFVLY